MAHPRVQVRVVCGRDKPAIVLAAHHPSEQAFPPTARRSIGILVALDSPLQVNNGEVTVNEADFVIAIDPSAIAHLHAMKSSVMLRKLGSALEPTPEHVDEIHVRRHQRGCGLHVVTVPGTGPV